MKESARSSLEDVKEEVVKENRKSSSRIGDTLERRVIEENVVEDVGEEPERELVEVIEEVEFIENEENITASLCER